MGPEGTQDRAATAEQAAAAQFAEGAVPGEAPAWEELDAGRYMPRRIKGSCKGRALG
jgi:hypothetical protein